MQRNERGRQGKQRAVLLKELREEERRRRIYDATDQLEMDPEIAAANIQVSGGSQWRGKKKFAQDSGSSLGMNLVRDRKFLPLPNMYQCRT